MISMSHDTQPPSGDKVSRTQLAALRSQIMQLDDEIIRLIGQRRDLAIEIGRVKQILGIPVLDPAHEAQVVRRAAEIARKRGVDPELAREVIRRIISAARQAQSSPSPESG